jgi:hypothetical protein
MIKLNELMNESEEEEAYKDFIASASENEN